jgi:hypothetical protein
MRRFYFLFVLLLLTTILTNAQTPRQDDSTKYIWYQNQYGLRQPRIASDSFFLPPYGDTTGRRPYRNGALMMHTDGKYYKWNIGSGWNLASGGGGVDPSLNYKRIGFGGVGGKLSPGEAAFYYDSVTNQLGVDTVLSKKVWADSVNARNKIIINPTGESYAQIDGAQELGPGLFIRQQITNDGRDVNEHGVIDRTEFARDGKAYASFDAQPVITGANFDHYSAFQARPDLNITGTMSNAYILYSRPLLTGSGTITNLYHTGVPIDYTNNGTITNEYGSYIRTLKGVNRWAYYAVADKSFFGGNVGIGTDWPTYPLTLNKNGVALIGSWVNVAQISNAAGTAGIDLGYDNSTNDGIITSQGASSGFQFWTHNGSSFGLRGVFASGGNFGLGTGSPGRLLTLNNSIIPTLGFSRSDVEKALVGVSDATDHGVTGSAANDWFLRIVSGQKMLFSADEGATAHLTVSSAGIQVAGNATIANLSGTGTRMVVTGSGGSLSAQDIPVNTNFANSDLSATGNRSHNFKGFNLTVDSLKDYKLFSKGSFFGTPVRSSYQILPNTPSSGLLITYAFSKTDLSGDSVSVYLSGNPNNIDLGASDISNGHNSVVRVSNSGTGKSSIMLQTDSLSASMQPRSTYDSLVVVGSYNSGTKTNPVGKASLSDVRGYKIYVANLSQSGTSDPTAVVLGGNQIGSIVWTRTGLGSYTGVLSGAFISGKTFILSGQNADGITANCFRSDVNTVTLKTYLTFNGGSTDVFSDLSIEIRVYP